MHHCGHCDEVQICDCSTVGGCVAYDLGACASATGPCGLAAAGNIHVLWDPLRVATHDIVCRGPRLLFSATMIPYFVALGVCNWRTTRFKAGNGRQLSPDPRCLMDDAFPEHLPLVSER